MRFRDSQISVYHDSKEPRQEDYTLKCIDIWLLQKYTLYKKYQAEEKVVAELHGAFGHIYQLVSIFNKYLLYYV